MDVIDEQKLHSQVIDPAITRLRDEIVAPALAKIDALPPEIKALVIGLEQTFLNAVAEQAHILIDQGHGLLDRLNGTRVVMTPGGFELQIPPDDPQRVKIQQPKP